MPPRITRAILRWLPALAWMALIFWFSSQPDLPRPANDLLNLILRKSAHAGVYAVLALLYVWALGGWRWRWWAFGLAALYAVSDEFHQSFTPKRHPTATDVLIDCLGAYAGLRLGPHLLPVIVERVRSWAAGRDPAGAERRA
ncbi:VanZ family protein [Kallotenue papyrolyticum]|uniref:VanZ family protein n=1 Tax=Kallotenue papyrolyticum TaxID=1325125 RepID=UPI0004785E01|nr:VanZ family protein [Kallotenue papyrolyticum]